ncbi:MAG: response regulator transcription factor [Anaerolineales bacterium]|nr:response regulator transcription factor [Anaerolineales bacterium]
MQALLFAFHPEESALLSLLLKQAGFEVQVAKYLKPSVENWPEQPLDLICLILENDYQQDITTIKKLRGHTVVPMIVITEPLTEDAEVALLEAGVDLIVTRPFGFRLLITRIKALLRRTAGVPFHGLPIMARGPLILDPSHRTIKVEERETTKLTQLEFRLLYVLMTHLGQIIPTENIVEHVWGYSGDGNRELVRGLVQRLRSKIELDKRNPKYILTEKGIGYYLDIDD